MHSTKSLIITPILIISLICNLSCAAPAPNSSSNGTGGSKCPNTNCTPAPGGTTCTSAYNRDDGCCPVWTCANGQSVYGKSSSSSSNTFTSNSFTFGSPPQLPGFPSFKFPSMGGSGGGGFPFFGRR